LRYSTYLGSRDSNGSNTIGGFMNGVIKEKLKIIPKDHKSASFLHRENHFPALCFPINCSANGFCG
jgi:hypothetical protein